ncbi:MAG: helix-turn-helix transcriptional regulator [Emcibacter sp.]|nr:helix-turn-helix transcriptional regulator [Emcibacter sp.]
MILHHADATLKAISGLCSVSSLAEISSNHLTPLMNLLNANSMIMGMKNQLYNEGWEKSVLAINLVKPGLRHYFAEFYQDDPVFKYSFFDFYRDTEIVQFSDVSQKATEPFKRFLSWSSVRHMLILHLNLGGASQETVSFGFHRDANKSDFSNSDKQLLQHIAPIILQVFRGMYFNERRDPSNDLINVFLSEVSQQNLVLLNQNLQIMNATPWAEKSACWDLFQPLSEGFKVLLEDFLQSGEVKRRVKWKVHSKDIYLSLQCIQSDTKYLLLTLPSAKNAYASILPKEKLTKRQFQVSELIVKGYTNWQIGEILNVSENTVVNHVAAIYPKLGVGSRSQLAAKW